MKTSLITLAAAPTSAAAPSAADRAAVIHANAQATNAGNVGAAMALFAGEAEMVNPKGATVNGKGAIRGWTQRQVDRKHKIEIGNIQVSDSTVAWDGKVIANTKAEAVVKDGKVISWTFK